MKYLWMKQKGEGCDYMIGCAEALVPLDGKTVEEILEYYGIDDHESELVEAKVLEEVEDAMPAVRRRISVTRDRLQAAERRAKEAEFERLKHELGK